MKRSPGVSRLILDSPDLGEFLEAFATLAARYFAADGNNVGCSMTVTPARRQARTGFSGRHGA